MFKAEARPQLLPYTSETQHMQTAPARDPQYCYYHFDIQHYPQCHHHDYSHCNQHHHHLWDPLHADCCLGAGIISLFTFYIFTITITNITITFISMPVVVVINIIISINNLHFIQRVMGGRGVKSYQGNARQRGRLNICCYIGWIDKYSICLFNKYNNKYWDGSAV